MPPDFSLDVSVVAGSVPGDGAQRAAGREVFTRPGHYILLPDGSLHWAAGDQPVPGLPPRRRVLDRRQVADLWALAQQLGLADPAQAMGPVNPRLLEVEPGQLVYLAILTGRQQRWAFERRVDAGQPQDPVMSVFVGRLAALAWVGLAPQPAEELQREYEFGPDPYARYR